MSEKNIYNDLIEVYDRLNPRDKIKYLELFVTGKYNELMNEYLLPAVNVIVTDYEIIIEAKKKLNIEVVKNDMIEKGFILGFPNSSRDVKKKININKYILIGIGQPICPN